MRKIKVLFVNSSLMSIIIFLLPLSIIEVPAQESSDRNEIYEQEISYSQHDVNKTIATFNLDELYKQAIANDSLVERLKLLQEIADNESINEYVIKARIDLLHLLYLKGDYEMVIQKANKYLKAKDLNRENITEMNYYLGLSLLVSGYPGDAREKFLEVLLNDPSSKIAALSQIKIGDSYLIENSYNKAMEEYNIALNNPAFLEFKGLLQLRIAECLLGLNQPQKSLQLLKEIIISYPNSIISIKAKELAEKLETNPETAAKEISKKPEEEKPLFIESPLPELPSTAQEESKKLSYTLQLGAFRSHGNALKLVQELEAKNYKPYIFEDKSGEVILYKVRIGHFDTIEEAKKISEKLQKEEDILSIFIKE